MRENRRSHGLALRLKGWLGILGVLLLGMFWLGNSGGDKGREPAADAPTIGVMSGVTEEEPAHLTPLTTFSGNLPINYFGSPLDIPLALSGNFGELRNNHFHSGLDLKTNGQIGLRVLAAQEGFISRVKIESGGYGKAIYITHPNGFKTVYAHLHSLNEPLAAWVKEQQYHRESFEVDLYPDPKQFVVRKGQLIAYSGNSGGSSGPHLHFEVRRASNDKPVNPLLLGFPVADNTPPVIRGVVLIPLSPESRILGHHRPVRFAVTKDGDAYKPLGYPQIQASGKIGFGVDVIDQLDGQSNHCGIYESYYQLDQDEKFRFTMDEFPFDQTRYINAHVAYCQIRTTGRKFQRTWILPGNALGNYARELGNGVIHVDPGDQKELMYTARDVYGNAAQLKLNLQGRSGKEETGKDALEKPARINTARAVPDTLDWEEEDSQGEHQVYWNVSTGFKNPWITLHFPAQCVYENTAVNWSFPAEGLELGSPIALDPSCIPFHRSYKLGLNLSRIPQSFWPYVCLLGADGRSKGGSLKGSWLEVSLREMGNFTISLDQEGPEIRPLNFTDGFRWNRGAALKIRISDKVSGIRSYSVHVDEDWILADFDAKTGTLMVTFEDWLAPGSHVLKISCRDGQGNLTVKRIKITI